MTLAADVSRLMHEAVVELGLASVEREMSDELRQFIDLVQRKAREVRDRDARQNDVDA